MYREANQCVDWLASFNLFEDIRLRAFSRPPSGLHNFLFVDASKVPILRIV